jgi:hypothetical protein
MPTAAHLRLGDTDTYPCRVTKRSPSLVATVALAATAPATALAGSGDIAATSRYLQADYALAHAANANVGVGQTAIRHLASSVAGQCPKAVAGSPQNHDSELLSEEVVGALSVVAFRPDAHAIAGYARTVHGLHWSNSALTRKVQTSATRLRGLSTLPVPDLCGDLRAWAASGFQTLSAGTTGFDRSYFAVDIEAEEIPWRLLAPFDRGEAPTIRAIKRIEAHLADVEAGDVKYWSRILDGLGLSP